MAWYKCFVNGQNYPGILANEEDAVGFYITRFVEAESSSSAEIIVSNELKNSERLKIPDDNFLPDNASIFFEYIEEIEKHCVPETQPGFTFYIMDT